MACAAVNLEQRVKHYILKTVTSVSVSFCDMKWNEKTPVSHI